MLKNRKISILIIILITVIFVGILITVTQGLNYDLIYSESKRATVYIDAEFNKDDVREIVKEVLGNGKIYLQESSNNEKIIAITAKEMSEEQLEDIVQKINEKYELEMNAEEYTYTVENGKVRGRDIVLPYVKHIAYAVVAVLVYFCIRYKKIELVEVTSLSTRLLGILCLSALVAVILATTQLLYLSILAIIRIPINTLTMPISLLIFLLTTIGLTFLLEKIKNKV